MLHNNTPPGPSYQEDEAIAVVSISGGKDSLATALLALERYGDSRVSLVHADTGHEHPLTERYVRDYLPGVLNKEIHIVKADFSDKILQKREIVKTKWVSDEVPDEVVRAALSVLQPTGIPFLDLCLWKGRFPSSRAQFCTRELKTVPLEKYLLMQKEKRYGFQIESWQGVRRDESRNRSEAALWEIGDFGGWIHRPIIHWSAQDAFGIAKKHGVDPNPLYKLGLSRVGCMPCINARKNEIAEISRRWPDVIDRIDQWEKTVSGAARRGFSTFFSLESGDGRTPSEYFKGNTFGQVILWSITSRGGRQLDIEQVVPPKECSSQYRLCE